MSFPSHRRNPLTQLVLVLRLNLLAVVLTSGVATGACATEIKYTVTETNVVTNTWQYSYAVSGGIFGVSSSAALSGFDVYFDPALYANIDSSPTAPVDWFVFTSEPSTALPANGAYTAQAVTDSASLANSFVVSVNWLGVGAPGAQPFDTFDGNFAVVQNGTTSRSSTAVPEPATLALLCVALVAFALQRRRSGLKA